MYFCASQQASRMKNLPYILAMCVLGLHVLAQDTPRPFEVGISTSISSSVNTVTPPRGWHIQPGIENLPDVFISTILPVWQRAGMAAGLDMGLTSSSVRCSTVTGVSDPFAVTMRYASVCPTVGVGNVFAGFGVHLPISARRVWQDGSRSDESVSMNGKEVSLRSLVGTMFDIRAGVVLPFIEDEHGVLSGLLSCSYQVSSFFTAADASAPIVYNQSTPSASYDPAVFHVRAGLRYLFSFFGGAESTVDGTVDGTGVSATGEQLLPEGAPLQGSEQMPPR